MNDNIITERNNDKIDLEKIMTESEGKNGSMKTSRVVQSNTMAITGIHHVCIQTRNYEQSVAFYCDVLGLEVTDRFFVNGRPFALIRLGDGNYLELSSPKKDTPQPGSPAASDPIIHVALKSTDVKSAIEYIREKGYKITVEPRQLDMGSNITCIAFFEGPNGERIELIQHVPIL